MAVYSPLEPPQGQQEADQCQGLWALFCETGLPEVYTLLSHQLKTQNIEKNSCKTVDVEVN